MGRAWEKLKTQDPFNPAPEDATPGQDAAGSASGTVPPVKDEPKQELKEEPGVEAVEPEGDMLVVSTDAFAMTALLYHTDGKMEQAPLHSGPGGVYWVTSSNGQSLATTLSAITPAPSSHALEDAAPPQQDTVMETAQDTAMEDAAPGLEGENELHEAMWDRDGVRRSVEGRCGSLQVQLPVLSGGSTASSPMGCTMHGACTHGCCNSCELLL